VRLILDSSVAISAERRGDTVQAFFHRVIETTGNQLAPYLLYHSYRTGTCVTKAESISFGWVRRCRRQTTESTKS
jgi:hypothetical protein